MTSPGVAPKPKSTLRLLLVLGGIAAGMLAITLNAATLYSAFCKATGYNGTTQEAIKAPSRVLDRTINVRFDVNVPTGTPLEFTTDQTSQTLKIGETGLAFFTVKNLSDRTVRAQAAYNVTPFRTGRYFQKLQCFCFKERVFAPHETAQLPVIYFVDPGIVADRETNDVHTITLSYTYFGEIS